MGPLGFECGKDWIARNMSIYAAPDMVVSNDMYTFSGNIR